MNEPHPVEALKAEVQELARADSSRTALRKKLVEAGRAEGLVDAAIESVYAERIERRSVAHQAAVDDNRRAEVEAVLEPRALEIVDALGVGDPLAADVASGAAAVRQGFVSMALIGLAQQFAASIGARWSASLRA